MKINIGCGGGWSADGWVGIDYSVTAGAWQQSTDKYIDLDIRNGLPYVDGSVVAVFTSHTLEHFTYNEILYVLSEIYRVLRVGGALCIVVPDMDIYIDRLLNRDESFLGTDTIIGGRPRNNLTDNFLMNFYSDPIFNNSCHKYSFNFENMQSILSMVGFESIEKVGFHKFSFCEELDDGKFISKIENIEKFSMCIQAKKCSEHSLFPNSEDFQIAKNIVKENLALGRDEGRLNYILLEQNNLKNDNQRLSNEIIEYVSIVQSLKADNDIKDANYKKVEAECALKEQYLQDLERKINELEKKINELEKSRVKKLFQKIIRQLHPVK